MSADYVVVVESKRSGMREIGPIFAPSAWDAEQDARKRMKRGEVVIDVFSGRISSSRAKEDFYFDEEPKE